MRAANLSKSALAEEMAAAGMNALSCVLQPDRIPDADSVRDKPPDIMHLYGAGLTRTEGAHMLEILFKDRKAGTELAVAGAWSKLNANIAALNVAPCRSARTIGCYAPPMADLLLAA